MSIHTLYPGFVKLFYDAGGHPHVQVLPVIPDDHEPGVEPRLCTSLAPTVSSSLMSTLINNYITTIKPMFSTAAQFQYAEFWSVASVGADPLFEYVMSIGVAGTSGTAATALTQAVLTFKAIAGGTLKLYFMETSNANNQDDPFPFANATIAAIGNLVLDADDGFIFARDGSKPIAPRRFLVKTSDALRKKYMLNA